MSSESVERWATRCGRGLVYGFVVVSLLRVGAAIPEVVVWVWPRWAILVAGLGLLGLLLHSVTSAHSGPPGSDPQGPKG